MASYYIPFPTLNTKFIKMSLFIVILVFGEILSNQSMQELSGIIKVSILKEIVHPYPYLSF